VFFSVVNEFIGNGKNIKTQVADIQANVRGLNHCPSIISIKVCCSLIKKSGAE